MLLKAIRTAITRRPVPDGGSVIRERIMHQIAVIGGQLFGSSDKQRLFYIRDRKTVVWKEGDITTYYQITDNGVIKSQTGQPQERISDLEARHLLKAVYGYHSLAIQYLKDNFSPAQ